MRLPASLRLVTATRSNAGWRHSSCAASAPAKPDAPRTATLGTQLASQLAGQRGGDGLAPRGHLLVGERAVRRAEGQAQRERHAALPDLGPAVDVEHVDGLELWSAGTADDVDHARGRNLLGHD